MTEIKACPVCGRTMIWLENYLGDCWWCGDCYYSESVPFGYQIKETNNTTDHFESDDENS